jgi:hypothetical protein
LQVLCKGFIQRVHIQPQHTRDERVYTVALASSVKSVWELPKRNPMKTKLTARGRVVMRELVESKKRLRWAAWAVDLQHFPINTSIEVALDSTDELVALLRPGR